MTQDQLTQGEALNISINSLTQLGNTLNGTISSSGQGKVPGVDQLLALCLQYGIIDGAELTPFLKDIQGKVDDKLAGYQKEFDSL